MTGFVLTLAVFLLALAFVVGSYVAKADESENNKALLNAAQQGLLDRLGRLLEKGGEVNTKDKFGRTPLMLASINGHTEVVKLLLDKTQISMQKTNTV